MGSDVVAGGVTGQFKSFFVAKQTIEDVVALKDIADGESPFTHNEIECLAEVFVTRSKDDRNAIDSSLRNIVYA